MPAEEQRRAAAFLADAESFLGAPDDDVAAVYDRAADRYDRFRELWLRLAGGGAEAAMLDDLRAVLALRGRHVRRGGVSLGDRDGARRPYCPPLPNRPGASAALGVSDIRRKPHCICVLLRTREALPAPTVAGATLNR